MAFYTSFFVLVGIWCGLSSSATAIAFLGTGVVYLNSIYSEECQCNWLRHVPCFLRVPYSLQQVDCEFINVYDHLGVADGRSECKAKDGFLDCHG